jgi:DNA-directed RNA polymerase subunit RPC12/RpoP
MDPEKAETGISTETASGFRCTSCGFTLDASCGGYLYVKNNNGVKVPLKGKAEQEAIAHILLNEELSLRCDDPGHSHETMDVIEERVGYISACVCMNCLDQFGLDLRKDTMECPRCRSGHVSTFLEIMYKPCPRCQSVSGDKENISL